MNWRTQTRPNGQRDHRDVVTGWGARLGYVSAIAGLAGVIWAASARFTVVEKRLDAITEELPDKIALALARAARDDGAEFVGRREFDEYRAEQIRQFNQRLDAFDKRLDSITDYDRHLLGVAEKLPGAKGKP